MAYPMLVDPAKNAWLIPFSIILLPAFLGIFIGMTTYISMLLSRSEMQLVFIFPVIWVFIEWVRGSIFTGFPWNLIGYSFTNLITISQTASIVGVYGLSLLAVSLCVSFSLLGSTKKINLLLPVMFTILFGVIHLLGSDKLNNSINEYKSIKIRLVQANILQNEKWLDEFRNNNFMKHYNLSKSDNIENVDLIIWPETALTFTSPEKISNRKEMQDILDNGALLLSGMPRVIIDEDKNIDLYNSIVVFDKALDILDSYDKVHLVPFGEYLPFRNILDYLGFSKLVFGEVDYSKGNGPKTIRLGKLPGFSPLICFEIIFPGKVIDPNDRPEWLISISNDAWFGNYAGPWQHFEMARIRSIEEGLPLVRVSNTGISGVIDSYGRILKLIPYGESGVLDHYLPASLPSTLYSRFGDIIVFTIGILIISFVFLWQLIRKISN